MAYTICADNLFPHVYVNELCKVFEKYGRITKVEVDTITTSDLKHKGFIVFDKFSSAQCAAAELNGLNILGNPMKVKIITKEGGFKTNEFYGGSKTNEFTKVFVKNFDTNWDECDLLKIFAEFGEVINSKVFKSNGKSKGYGFVEFNNHISAKNAIKAMHHQLVNDKKLIVEPYEYRHPNMNLKCDIVPPTVEMAKAVLEKSVQLNNLHVKNLPKDMTDEELKALFQPYGKVESVKIARDQGQVSRGFGFVSFTNAKDAGLARDKVNETTYKSSVLEVNFNQKKEARRQYLNLVNSDKVRKFSREKEFPPKNSSSNILSFSGKNK